MRLLNVEEIAKKHPTFRIIPRAELNKLKVGDNVKVVIPGERFWVQITKINQDESYMGE